jgi:preprotein translocase subunit SecG
MSIVIWLLTFALVLLSVFLVLIVLAQKSKSDGGVGAALGGGMTEATFGADSGNVLATMTRNGAIAFFVLSFGLYLAHIARAKSARAESILPKIEVPAVPAPVATPAAASAPAAAEASAPAVSVALPSVGTPAATTPAPVEPAK